MNDTIPSRIDRGFDPNELICRVREAAGLNLASAKTLVYVLIASHGLPKLNRFPIVVLLGPPGTGKSTILNIARQVAFESGTMSGRPTPAVLRDKMVKYRTLLMEEADDVDESAVARRFDRYTGREDFKRQSSQFGWGDHAAEIFGASILHRRVPLGDAGVESRCIFIATEKQEGPFISAEGAFQEYQGGVAGLARAIDWRRVSTHEGGRVNDVLAPLLLVAEHLEDYEYLSQARELITQRERDLEAGQELEPRHLAYKAVLSLGLERGVAGALAERVLLADVTARIAEEGRDLGSHQVGGLLRSLGIVPRTVGGRQYVYPDGPARLRTIGRQLGIPDEWLDEEHEMAA